MTAKTYVSLRWEPIPAGTPCGDGAEELFAVRQDGTESCAGITMSAIDRAPDWSPENPTYVTLGWRHFHASDGRSTALHPTKEAAKAEAERWFRLKKAGRED